MIPRARKARRGRSRLSRRVRTAAARAARRAVRRADRFIRRYALPIAAGLFLAVLVGVARTAALAVGLSVLVVWSAAHGLVLLLDRVEARAPRVDYAGGVA